MILVLPANGQQPVDQFEIDNNQFVLIGKPKILTK